jgi:hypothetical protein
MKHWSKMTTRERAVETARVQAWRIAHRERVQALRHDRYARHREEEIARAVAHRRARRGSPTSGKFDGAIGAETGAD